LASLRENEAIKDREIILIAVNTIFSQSRRGAKKIK
jgi:hypothetical protein